MNASESTPTLLQSNNRAHESFPSLCSSSALPLFFVCLSPWCRTHPNRSSYSCSRECQVADWPRHKPFCKEAVRRSLLEQEEALSAPYISAMRQDTRLYLAMIHREIEALALRSALRLGKADCLRHTHGLTLSFDYDRRTPELRQRFVPTAAEVRKFEDMAVIVADLLDQEIFNDLPRASNADVQRFEAANEGMVLCAVELLVSCVNSDVIISEGELVSLRPRAHSTLTAPLQHHLRWSSISKSGCSSLPARCPSTRTGPRFFKAPLRCRSRRRARYCSSRSI